MSTFNEFISALHNIDIDNVLIYVGDAVRWDSLHERISRRGTTIKTVAASTTSAPSFSSLLSGLYPTSHHVHTFEYRLDESTLTVLDLDGYTTAFRNSIFEYADREHEGLDPIYSMLNIDDAESISTLDEIKSPFVYFERGPGGHAPYGDFSKSSTEYFETKFDISKTELRDDYTRSIDLDRELFQGRLQTLKESGHLGNTLVIYSSDHGELLGEDGMVGHNPPMRPETVYVPTVFVHDALPEGELTDGIMRHVDLLPTVLSVLGIEHESSFDGRSLLECASLPDIGFTVNNNEFLANPLPYGDGVLRYEGAWDYDGGHVFPQSSRPKRLLILAGKLYMSPKRHYLRKNINDLVKSYMLGEQTFGQPGFTSSEAKAKLSMLRTRESCGLRQELSHDDKERLKDLGYL